MTEKKTGRPQIEIDKQKFEFMCSIMATLEEIAGLFDCSEDTIERWCKRTYTDDDGEPMRFADVLKRYSASGKISLRRAQWESAKNGNATMQIWLGRNWLGQSDNKEITHNVDIEDLQPLAEMLKHDENTDDTVATVLEEA